MKDTDSPDNRSEIAAKLEQLLQSRERLKVSGEDVEQIDRQILPFKTQYMRNGAIYGANSIGMVRWFAEAQPDQSAAAAAPSTTEGV